jgi:replicative DNA helicase
MNETKFRTYIRRKARGHKGVLKSGFQDIDDLVSYGGLPGNTMIALLGKSGTGKTFFIVNWVARILKSYKNIKVLFFSMEMKEDLLNDRIMQLIFEVNIKDQKLYCSENEDYMIRKLKDIGYFEKLTINDGQAQSIETIEVEIAALRPHFVFIDYLQLISTPKNPEIYAKTNHIMDGFKKIKDKYNTRIIAASQLRRSREYGKSGDLAGSTMPSSEDAKGGSEIEDKSDMVLGMWKPDINPECKTSEKGVIKGFFLKNRYASMVPNGIMSWHYNIETGELL